MEERNYDVAVIGAGPGGYVAAIRAAQLGLKTAIVERDRVGGICLNWGCIPTKALLRSAELFGLFQRAREFGLTVEGLKPDFQAVVKRSRQVADRLARGVEFLLRKNKVQLFPGSARIVGRGKLAVESATGVEELSAKHIIVATGARPRALPDVQFDGKQILTSKEAMTLESPPKSIVIVGAGPIGVEFAYFFRIFGSEVTLLEMMPQILPLEDAECAEVVAKSFRKSGIQVVTGARVVSVEKTPSGLGVMVEREGQQLSYEGEVALVAVGVQANVEGMGLEELGVELERGFIKVDAFGRTNVDGIYAIGDVIGPPLLAHVASHEGIVCVEAIAGRNPQPLDYSNVPSCTYCQPQIASIGLTEEKAKSLGHEVRVGRFPFRANGKSLALGETEGFVKLIFDQKHGELLGAHIVGPEATELVAELAVAKTLEGTFEEIASTIHAHPTLSEAVMEAALDADGRAIHI
jgi:dihydrolipoamide dehydrogenase